jgi:diguanylate cyclase (GGDEF)-like protein
LLADVDNFKSVNDTYGHDKGDDVLRDLAQIFKNHVRKEDVAARYGGEEFVLLLTNCSSTDAAVIAERIRKATESHAYEWMDNKPVTISIGIATFPEIELENSEELVQAADHAMYKAKLSGKNKVVISEGLDK